MAAGRGLGRADPPPGRPMTTSPDNRQSTRHAFEEEVEFIAPRACTGRSIDLAAGGIGVILDEPFATGQSVQLKILGGRVIVQGTVQWCREAEGAYRVGIQFSEEDWSVLEHIRTMQGET